jgi:hypothetical protein
VAVQTQRTADQIARERSARFQAQQMDKYGRKATAQDMRRAADALRDQRRGGR